MLTIMLLTVLFEMTPTARIAVEYPHLPYSACPRELPYGNNIGAKSVPL